MISRCSTTTTILMRVSGICSRNTLMMLNGCCHHRRLSVVPLCHQQHKQQPEMIEKHQGTDENRTSYVGPPKVLWDGHSIGNLNVAQVDYNDLFNDDDAIRYLLKSILIYGFAFINNVPSTSEGTRSAMECIGPIWPTFWGQIYHVVADISVHSHPSYTGGDLALHTDTNYYYEGGGLQAFQVLKHTGTGGKNILVDGFQVAQNIRTENSSVYKYLSSKTYSFKYIADGKLYLRNEDKILKHHPVSSELVQVRFSPYDVDTFWTVPQEDVPQHYEALKVFRNEIENSVNAHWIQLNEGRLLITDNWRILHGRSSFTGARTLCGMYISRSDFLSRARKLNIF